MSLASKHGAQHLRRTLRARDASTRLKRLSLTEAAFARGSQAGERQLNFHWRATQEEIKLLKIKAGMVEETGTQMAKWIDLSAGQTFRELIVRRDLTKADELRSVFRMSEKACYHIKVHALSAIHDWAGLREFSRKKRPPIGFDPFAEACIEHGDMVAAVYYIDRIPADAEKLALYKRAAAWEKAVDTALRMRDGDALRMIQRECRDLTLIGKIETHLRRNRL